MTVLLWIVFGAIVGWIASLIMRTNATQGVLMDIIVGILGAVIGGFVMNFFGQPGVTGFNVWSTVVSVIGAILLIGIVRAFQRT